MGLFKRALLLFLFVNALSTVTHAQKERNVWCFGMYGEIDFNSGTPAEVQGCAINTSEGSASICDKTTGQLLFYTDGVKVYNRNNIPMPGNTQTLGGNVSTTQSALIVPMPGSDHQYYVFCTDAQAGQSNPGHSSAGDSGTQYTIIDMNLQGGLGDIAQQPRRLLTPTCEKISVAWMPNHQDYWIVVHQWNTYAFYAYPLTATGIGAPDVSDIGAVHRDSDSSFTSSIGYMRISPNGKKIAVAIDGELNLLQVFNFNDATGSVSGLVLSDTLSFTLGSYKSGPYGVCFSPNSQLVYTTVEDDSNIYQYNLQAGSSDAIKASKRVIGYTASDYVPNAMQTGPDDKIYVGSYDLHATYSQYIGSIDSPNVYGTGCHFEQDAIYLQDGFCIFGLPEFPPQLPVNCTAAPVTISADKVKICSGDSVPVCAPSGYAAYQWNGGGADSCIQAKSAGTYYVTATDNNGCTVESNHVSVSVYKVPSVSVTVIGDTLIAFNAVSYQWYLNNEVIPGATTQQYIASQQGSYAVQITDTNGCTATSSSIAITGVNDLATERFTIYPNPNSTGSWQMETTSELIGSKLEVFDEQGRMIFESVIRNTKQEIRFTAARGVYLLRISSAGNSMVRKLVKL